MCERSILLPTVVVVASACVQSVGIPDGCAVGVQSVAACCSDSSAFPVAARIRVFFCSTEVSSYASLILFWLLRFATGVVASRCGRWSSASGQPAKRKSHRRSELGRKSTVVRSRARGHGDPRKHQREDASESGRIECRPCLPHNDCALCIVRCSPSAELCRPNRVLGRIGVCLRRC